MKIYKRFAKVLIFILIIVLLNELFRYLLIDDSNSYTRLMMHEMYESEENIDILFLGSSRCYNTIIPDLLDEKFDAYTFNGGSAGQPLDATYYLLKEAVKYHDLQEVYIDIYLPLITDNLAQRKDLISTYLIADYMKPSIDKISFLLNSSTPEHYFNSFFLAKRDWEHLFNPSWIIENVKTKQTAEYKNFEYFEGYTSQYMGRGFILNNTIVEQGAFYMDNTPVPIEINPVSEHVDKYINKIIELCEEEQIKLTFYSIPSPDHILVSYDNYNDSYLYMKSYFAEKGYEYYDFNLCKKEYLDLKDTDFWDVLHLNYSGAQKFCDVFSDFFTGKTGTEIFYSSYEGVEDYWGDTVLAISIQHVFDKSEITDYPFVIDFDSYDYFKIEPVPNHSQDLEYKFWRADSDDKIYDMQDFNENNIVALPKGESGNLAITTRLKGTTDIINNVKFEY